MGEFKRRRNNSNNHNARDHHRENTSKTPKNEIDAFGRPLRGCCRCLPQELTVEYKEPIAITKYGSVSDETGKYSYNFEAANGIKMSEEGEQKHFGDKLEEGYGSVARGAYSYELEGVTYTINWVADENGFQPTGNHLPVAPPMPEYV